MRKRGALPAAGGSCATAHFRFGACSRSVPIRHGPSMIIDDPASHEQLVDLVEAVRHGRGLGRLMLHEEVGVEAERLDGLGLAKAELLAVRRQEIAVEERRGS